ncbi:MAG: VWA domain-containing protein [Bacillota bacterium]|nr:VWA domain-containing protein [Bacillota bacterium]
MEKYLENNMVTFIHVLRNAGMAVGSSELLDSLQAASLVNMAKKEELYMALAAVLVKSPMDLPLFTAAFESYFVPQANREAQVEEFREHQEEVKNMQTDFIFKENPLELSQEDMDTYAAMPENERQKIRQFVKMTDTGYNVSERHKSWLERSIRGALDFYRTHTDQVELVPVEATGQEEIDSVLYDIARSIDSRQIISKDMQEITGAEVKDAIILIRRLARRLATRIGRRYKRSAKLESVDMRRSLRRSLRYGGVMIDLSYRRRRVQKPNIILIADVSGSMTKYSRFFIQLMLGLSEVLPNMRCFAFSDHLAKLDLRYFDPEADDFGQFDGLGDTTNLHTALSEFLTIHDKKLNKRTVVMILSDAKTLEYDATAELLRYIARKTKEILWLNPTDKDEWGRYPMVEAFLPYVSMHEAASIEKLTKALRHI